MKMDEETYLGNLRTLKELILDEEKIVTYISLSKDLCIHVNEAKSLLNRVCKEIRESEPKTVINVCYLISGLLDNNSGCTAVCSELDIETIRKTFKLIFYEHVYCVSRGVQGGDSAALTAINKFEDLPLCTGLIKANACVKRTNDEIEHLKHNSNQSVVVESQLKSNITKKHVSEKAKETASNGQVTVVKANSEPIIKSKTPSPKKDVTANNNKINSSKNVAKPAKGIAGFFNKMNGNLAKSSKAKLENGNNAKGKLEAKLENGNNANGKFENVTTIETNNSDEISDTIKKEVIDKANVITNSNLQKGIKKNTNEKLKNGNDKIKNEQSSNKLQNKTSNKTASLKQIKKNAKVDKKRKRVLHVSDSESETEVDDPFAEDDKKVPLDHESEDEIPPTPTINTVKITSGIVNPKKRRKIVDKTYTDEEGYILTKKEEVYESCSDDEMDIKTNTQEKENVKQATQFKIESPEKVTGKGKKKKVSPPQKGQQKMMTNFFKKL